MNMPLFVLASVVFVVIAIGWWRIHAFFALIFAAIFVSAGITLNGGEALESAIIRVMTEFGSSAGRIGYTIAVAAVVGEALLRSGAARAIVSALVRAFGESRAPYALALAGFILGIPVFFDTVFFLLVPIALAFSRRNPARHTLFVTAICTGAVVTHVTVPPTPGPLALADLLSLDLGRAIGGGILAGIAPAAAGLAFCYWINRRLPGALLSDAGATSATNEETPEPPLVLAVVPVVLPLVLITVSTFIPPSATGVWGAVRVLGEKNVALTLGAVFALGLCRRPGRQSWRETMVLCGPALEAAGVVILITAAGGAYGGVIKASGVGDLIEAQARAAGIPLIPLAWTVALALRAAQGSSTVAIITTAGILQTMIPADDAMLRFCLFLAIGYGSLGLSWMNDSGFWVFSRLAQISERDTLRTWTPLLQVISCVGLAEAWLLSLLL